MSRLGTITGEGFISHIEVEGDAIAGKEHVSFVADGDIDADGANGQRGGRAAYMADDSGSELLANGGMGIRGGKVVFTTSWGPDIVFTKDGRPLVLPNGVIPSKTSLKLMHLDLNSPEAQVDSETIKYAVVPPLIVSGTDGIVMGCRVRVTYLPTGLWAEGIIGDAGPRNKIGEISIAMAKALKVPSSPRNGGVEKALLRYDVYPGEHGEIDGAKVALQTSKGKLIFPV